MKAAGIAPLVHGATMAGSVAADERPNPDVAAAGTNPLVHYLTNRIAEGRRVV